MNQASPAVKIGTSRQVVIPKKIHDQLKLSPGDYRQVKVEGGRVVFTPKTLVDKYIQVRIGEGLNDVQAGRVSRRFRSAQMMGHSLRGSRRPLR